jgi:hypothetical protein
MHHINMWLIDHSEISEHFLNTTQCPGLKWKERMIIRNLVHQNLMGRPGNIKQYTIPQTQTRKQSSSIKIKRLHYPTRSMRVDWYKARNSKWFILAKPGWKWNIRSPRTLNKLVRTRTLPEHKPAQAQSKGRYILFTQYTVLRHKYEGIVGISFKLGHQHQVSFVYISCNRQTNHPFYKWHRKGSSKPQGSSRGEMHYVFSVQLLIPHTELNNEIA